jgi:1-deoxy-D-xylulose-5-phosphate synthase
VLHLLTQKGKGFPVALEEPEKWHGSGPFDKLTGQSKPSSPTSPPKYQDVFGECLSSLASRNENIVGITAAMPSGTGLDALYKAIPERFFDVGIAEEHAVLLAAGMATGGKLPVCAIYSTFLQRAYDPIIHDVCLQNLAVTFCLDRAGLSPNDGPTHHGLFDLSYLRCIPNGIVMQPKDEDELQDMMTTGIESNCPAFIRYPRGEGVGVERKKTPIPLEVGKAEVLRKGSLCAIWAIGDFVQIALSIANQFKKKYGIEITVVNARFIKPIDSNTLLQHSKSHDSIITMEDNVLMGGFGSAILEELERNDITIPVKRFGWPDKFIEHGNSVEELRSKVGLDRKSVELSIASFLSLQGQEATPIFA